MATINGTFNSLIAGTLSGTVATPGAPGVGVPAGGLTGQVLTKATNGSYETVWATFSPGATESWVTTNFLSKAGNLAGLTDLATARDNIQLGTLNNPTFAGVAIQGAGANLANLGATFLSLNHGLYGSFMIDAALGITFPDTTVQTTAFTSAVLIPYAPLNSPLFTGDPRGPTAALGDNDTSLATTAFVQQELLSGTANARNLEVYVRNQTGSTIPAGSIVYINGATGNRPTITLAQANNDANSAQTFGFTKTAIANNGFGFVIVRGELENIDTSALTEGVQLYLSPTTAGTWTTTKPSAPQHLVYVGIVVRAHPTQGVILVAIQNGYEINELHDVKITSPTNGQVLKYDSTQSLWVNGTDVGGVAWGGITGTLSSQLDLQGALDLKANLSGATFTGKVNTTVTATTAALNIAPQATPPTSTVAGDVWIGTNINFRSFDGVAKAVANTNTQNQFSSVQAIDVNSASNALRITQRGTGPAIVVEDSTTPDSTAFVVDQFGKVGIGVAPDATAALKVDTNGIMFGDGTTQTTAAVTFTGGAITSPITYTVGTQVSTMANSAFSVVNSATSESVYVNVSSINVTGADGVTTLYSGGIQFPDTTVQLSAGIAEAPIDSLYYGRGSASWVPVVPEAPNDGNYYVRKDGGWVQLNTITVYDTNGDPVDVFKP